MEGRSSVAVEDGRGCGEREARGGTSVAVRGDGWTDDVLGREADVFEEMDGRSTICGRAETSRSHQMCRPLTKLGRRTASSDHLYHQDIYLVWS